jgi:short-subunit dehydrogenase
MEETNAENRRDYGAGAGVGRAVANEFALRGDWVALIGRDPDRLAVAVEEIERLGVQAAAFPADVADWKP